MAVHEEYHGDSTTMVSLFTSSECHPLLVALTSMSYFPDFNFVNVSEFPLLAKGIHLPPFILYS